MAKLRFKEVVAKNYRAFIVGGLFLALVIILIVFLTTRGTDVAKEGEDNKEGVVTSNIEVPKDKYEEDAYPNVNNIVTSYMDAMSVGDSDTMASLSNSLSDERRAFFEAQAQYIGNYSDYHCYTKKGPEDNSYIVLTTYTLLIREEPTRIPGLLSLYVCTDTSGALYINNGDLSADDEAYILAIVSQDDFVKLQDEIQLQYNDIINSNTQLATRVSELRAQINSDVQAKLEAKKQAETEAAALAAAEGAAALAEANAKTVRATDNVNIRASASTEADQLGKATAGQEFTRYEVMDNGWSKIDYNGQEAYIKSEYLEEVNESEAGAEGEQTEEKTREAGSTIKVKENVNIRSGANTDSEILGKANGGDTFTLIEEVNGWCKFTYNGKDAYIRSDFIE